MSSKPHSFQLDDIVIFRYTGEKATIIECMLDGTYKVLDDTYEETIAFAEDIVPIDQFNGIEDSPYQIAHKKSKTPSIESLFYGDDYIKSSDTSKVESTIEGFNIAPSYKKLIDNIQPQPSNKGIFTCLLDQQQNDELVLFMVNDADISFRFSYQLLNNRSEIVASCSQHIDRYTFFAIDVWSKDLFNNGYTYIIEIKSLDIKKTHKLKIQKLHSTKSSVPLIQLKVPSYVIATPPFYRQNTKIKVKQVSKSKFRRTRVDRLRSFADFQNMIDLHADQLIDEPAKWSPKDILDCQMKSLETYIDQAIGMNLDVVYIIHGIGQGKLKEYVHQFLKRHKLVKKFVNEYHEKFGFGATEVHF